MSEVKKRPNMIDLSEFSSKFVSNRIIVSRTDQLRDKRNERKNNAHTFKQSEVRDTIRNFTTWKSQEELVKISESLYVQSPQYMRLINYWSNLPTYDYVITPKEFIEGEDKDKILEDYKKTTKFLLAMSLKLNLTKIIRKALISDVFFGYAYIEDDSIMIQQMPFEVCKISSIEDNAYNYAIDLEALGKNKDLIYYYPMEIQKAYEKYVVLKDKNREKAFKWYEVPAKNSVCIKINHAISEIIPPFAGVFDSIYDINAFKDLRNDKAELENYKLLIQKLPVRENTNENNDFIIDMPMMNYFHNELADVVPTNVGVATTPMKVEAVTFDKTTAGADGVTHASEDFWNSSGVSKSLFSGDGNTAQAILKSIDVDEQYIFDILHQLEIWINRFLKANDVSEFFHVVLPDVTHFSREKMLSLYVEQGQHGFPVKTYVASLLGLEPVAFNGLLSLENDILELQSKMIPFTSTYTTSGQDIADTGGRPTNDELGRVDSDETDRAKNKSSTIIED